MTTVVHKQTPPNSYSHIDLRRHSSAHPMTSSPPVSRNGSTTSTRSQPAWMTSIADRDRQDNIQSTPEKGLRGLFGRKKSAAEPKKEGRVVVGSKHAALVKNNLKADPRGARKHPSVPPENRTARVVGTTKSAHITAEQQEMRHPHSGPPTLRGSADLPMLTRIVSGDEDDKWEQKDWKPELEIHGEEDTGAEADFDTGRVEELQARRKSLLDVGIKAGEGVKPARRKTVFGGWAKDSRGIWTRA